MISLRFKLDSWLGFTFVFHIHYLYNHIIVVVFTPPEWSCVWTEPNVHIQLFFCLFFKYLFLFQHFFMLTTSKRADKQLPSFSKDIKKISGDRDRAKCVCWWRRSRIMAAFLANPFISALPFSFPNGRSGLDVKRRGAFKEWCERRCKWGSRDGDLMVHWWRRPADISYIYCIDRECVQINVWKSFWNMIIPGKQKHFTYKYIRYKCQEY